MAQTNTFPVTGSTGIGTITPNAPPCSNYKYNQSMLMPRMTSHNAMPLLLLPTGLMIYQTNSTPGFYYYSGTAWVAVTVKSKGWSLTGNAGTGSINFIGSTEHNHCFLK
jgi:hypothetical protein